MGAVAPPAVPGTLARFAHFAGRIQYSGHRTDVPTAPEVSGTVTIGDDGFILEERTSRYVLHADAAGAVVRSGAIAARAAQALDADALVNPWAIAMASLARGELSSRGHGAWQTNDGIIIYMDADGASVAGMTAGQGGRLAFTFAAWGDVGGLAVPTRILRLRHGISDAAFQIDRLDIVRAGQPTAGQIAIEQTQPANQAAPATVATQTILPDGPPFPLRLMLTMFGFMLLAVALVAWFRRDAFAVRLCRQRAEDARAWRGVASAAYVNADGVLQLEGNEYRVGPEFFSRSVEVQHSALFVRISAPGVTRAIVLPRRLPRPVPPRRHVRRHLTVHGLSLIETLVSVAFFAVVVVGAVYPSLVAVARADFVAAQKRAALVAAANALTDEEAACAYGQAAPTGVNTTTSNGMTVVVTVSNASVPGARDIVVSARDSAGEVLATLATTVGPPVPPPGLGGPPNTGAPPPSGSPPVPTPPPSASPTPHSGSRG